MIILQYSLRILLKNRLKLKVMLFKEIGWEIMAIIIKFILNLVKLF